MQVVLTVVLVVAAAVTDLLTRRIPNKLTFAAAVAGLLTNLVLAGWQGLAYSVAGGLVGLSLLFIPFAMGGIGAADVKLMAAVGTLMGPGFAFYATCYGAIAGGIMALLLLLLKGELRWVLAGLKTGGYRSQLTLPYGVPLAAGVLYYLAVII